MVKRSKEEQKQLVAESESESESPSEEDQIDESAEAEIEEASEVKTGQDEEDDDEEDQSQDSDAAIAQRDINEKDDLEKKFGQKAINDEKGMLERLREIQLNFYNRLESKKLIKKQGKVPFTEHMTISKTPFQSVLFTPDMI